MQWIDGRNWMVTEAFHYDTGVRLAGYGVDLGYLCRITVPQGFRTDFASIPRVLWNLLPPTGSYGLAAVVHDYLYRTYGLCTRKQADDVLWEAMTFLKVGWATKAIIYTGVRVGGHWSYKGGL